MSHIGHTNENRNWTRSNAAVHDQLAAQATIKDAASRLAAAYERLDDAHYDCIQSGDTIQAAAIASVMRQCAVLMEGVVR